MKTNKVLASCIFLLVIAELFSFASAAVSDRTSVSRTTYQYPASFQTYYGSQGRLDTYWPILGDREQCEAREDILLQVAPGGCQPAVVRSDLIAEQNVPVFCQIDALSINPLVDIKEIRNIRFTGNYPKEVVGTGFHPARAAIRTRDKLLGDPLINNIGYVVLVLKRNEKEKELPKFVTVNLSAQIDYDTGNSFGVGRAEFILRPVNDNDWELEKDKQSFWGGRYSVRLNDVDSKFAIVTLYRGDQKVSNTRVERGQRSPVIYMPGYFCRAGVQVEYTGFVGAETKARVEISDEKGTDTFDVYAGSTFLNDKCRVVSITKSDKSSNGNVQISCTGGERFNLQIQPRIDQILKGKDGNFIKPELEGSYLKVSIDSEVYSFKEGVLYKKSGDKWSEISKTDLNKNNGRLRNVYEALRAYSILSDAEKNVLSQDKITDEIIKNPAEAEKAFNEAIGAYKEVADSYPLERSKDQFAAPTYGEQSLKESLKLIKDNPKIKKVKTQLDLLERINNLYPDSLDINEYQSEFRKVFITDSSLAGNLIFIDNGYKTIRLLSIDDPEELSEAVFSFSGRAQEYKIKSGESILFKDKEVTGDLTSLRLDRVIDEDSVKAVYICKSTIRGSAGESRTVNIQLNERIENVCGTSIRLVQVNMKELAKIRLLPFAKGTRTETNLTVNIGIEKRIISLSPNKTAERIKNLNESIKKWEQISNNLGKVVKGMKAACFATAAALNVKNFISGIDGTALAREQAMQGDYGWTARCREAVENKRILRNDGNNYDVSYRTLTECFNKEKALIEKEVQERKKVIEETNSILKRGEKREGSFAGGYTVDNIEAQNNFIKFLKSNPNYMNDPFVKSLETVSKDKPAAHSYEDLRNWYLNKQLEKSFPSAGFEIKKIEKRIKENEVLLKSSATAASDQGIERFAIKSPVLAGKSQDIEGRFLRITKNNGKILIDGTDVNTDENNFDGTAEHSVLIDGRKIIGDKSEARRYLVVGTKPSGGNILAPSGIYEYAKNDLGKASLTKIKIDHVQFYNDNNIKEIKDSGGDLSRNVIVARDRAVRYFETGPDKGLPAIVPFDVLNGWYARVKSDLKIGNQLSAYDSSGLPRVWWICNVGGNGAMDSIDECTQVFAGINSNAPILGLDERKSKDLVEQSRRSLLEAASQKGSKVVRINGQELHQGVPYSQFDGVQCQDFMSPQDCKILFNVCDPVICPTTRCDFGGKYPVSDVIQTGIVGSTLLCLPNYREGVYVPVCLSGVHAGIDSYVTILKTHRDCLQENLQTGRMVGICDEFYSIYACEFFWRQVAPVANVLLPKLVEFAYGGGQGARGGGEYLTVMGAWQNTQKSIDYFTQTYAVNSLKAFRARSVEEIGSQFCRGFLSIKGPKTIKSLIEPDSPPQFTAYFDSVRFSDATVPATAQYKVFYHIFAGKDSGVHYSIYLKNPPESTYYYNTPFIAIATGFIARGEFKTETRDFTAPEGYKELCVRINDEEKCGFKQISTEFALNYLRDKAVSEEQKKTDITTEKECVSGSPSIGPLLNPNIQAGIEEAALPQIYERGIVRICSTRNPGLTTDPTRYVNAGYCGSKEVVCWTDKYSVENSITSNNIGVKNDTLSVLEKKRKSEISGMLGDGQANGKLYDIRIKVDKLLKEYSEKELSGIKTEVDAVLLEMDSLFGSNLQNLQLNHHKAEVLFLKAKVKGIVVRKYLEDARNEGTSETKGDNSVQENIDSDKEGSEAGAISLERAYSAAAGASDNYIYINGKKSRIYLQREKVLFYDIRWYMFNHVIGEIKAKDKTSKQYIISLFGNSPGLFSDTNVRSLIGDNIYNTLNGTIIDTSRIN